MKLLFHFILAFSFLGPQNIASQTAPDISYPNTSYIFTKEQVISPLTPINVGGPVSSVKIVSTLAGNGTHGHANGTGVEASFSIPSGVVLDTFGNLFVVDIINNTVRKITPEGKVTTFAGSGEVGDADGIGTAASFHEPSGIVIDASGNFYVAESANNKIRKITPEGIVTTFAGSGEIGDADGTGTAASFSYPFGIAIDAFGYLYVADSGNNKIRKITPAGVVTTFAGSGIIGDADGTAAASSFYNPHGVTLDSSGSIYVADTYNNKIRKITSTGVVTTIAGSGTEGATNGIGTAASFYMPFGVTLDASENLYVADTYNHKIRKITSTGVVTTIAGSGLGTNDGTGTTAKFSYPYGIVINASGFIYISDTYNPKIRKITHGLYSISPTLPIGLTFDIATGVISGTPTTVTPTTTYTILASNAQGSSSFDITITVNEPTKPDSDNDGIPDQEDNCPETYNSDQTDTNNNGIGDICDVVDLLISEAFTPNGDTINDTWMIYNIEKYTNTSVRVFNRWGNEVFYSKDYKNDWNGNGLPESAYYYIVQSNGIEINNYEGWLYITK